MSDIDYRDASVGDAEALAEFSARTFVDTFGHLYPPGDLKAYLAETYGAELQAREIEDPELHYHLALREGRIVGYCRCGALKIDVDVGDGFEVHRLYVDGDTKGSGVAQALMDEALAWAKARGARAMYLSVWENNHRAQRFYKRYGFEHVGEHKFMVGSVADRDFIWRMTL